ncbi:acetyltransferase [Roseburia sp. BX1005]|uniref:Acetyltransferase n=1 Tax=Roseburia zhanii TaxID=2763064 RepID=A0A923LSH6_9FIRM|nr:acetyltransferase [Roseburia zhanii]MBC5715249.1 acetyltransferase [Roseburia zhanii]
MKDLYIIGAGGFGREVAWLVERINDVSFEWNLKGFIDDDESIWGSKEDGYPVLGGCEYLKKIGDVYAVCAVGSAKVRKKIINKLADSQVRYATLVDPSVIMSKRIRVGEGSIICAGTIITVDVIIGKHVIVNLDCTLGHDDIINDFVTMYPSVNVSGNVEIGECSELGTGAQIIQGKKIVPNTIIGAGAVVVKDIEEKGTYVGSPVRKIR